MAEVPDGEYREEDDILDCDADELFEEVAWLVWVDAEVELVELQKEVSQYSGAGRQRRRRRFCERRRRAPDWQTRIVSNAVRERYHLDSAAICAGVVDKHMPDTTRGWRRDWHGSLLGDFDIWIFLDCK